MVLVMTTLPTRRSARKLADTLLSKKLAACITISGSVESHYRWKGKREIGKEVILWIKTQKKLSQKVERVIRNYHPYEVPEIVVLPVTRVNVPYKKWLLTSTK